METSFGFVRRRGAFYGAHSGRVERIGYRRPMSQDTCQRRYINQSRSWQSIPGERQTSGGQAVRRNCRHG